MAKALQQRLSSISNELVGFHIARCGKLEAWEAHIAEPADNFRTNICIQTMTLTSETRFYLPQSIDPPHGSLLSPLGLESLSDTLPDCPSLDFSSPSTSPVGPSSLYPSAEDFNMTTPSSISGSDLANPAPEMPARMANQDLGYLGFDQWNKWPEQ